MLTPRYALRVREETNVKKEWDAIMLRATTERNFAMFPILMDSNTNAPVSRHSLSLLSLSLPLPSCLFNHSCASLRAHANQLGCQRERLSCGGDIAAPSPLRLPPHG